MPCARCHAFDGAADGSGAFPKLAGLPAYYMAKELRDFASGMRADAIMSAIARKMKPEESRTFLNIIRLPTQCLPPLPVAEPDLLTLGTRLATVGDEEKRIQACEGCHGAQGRGEAPAIPPLAGQYAHYIDFQMQMWQKGYRKNDANQQMANIARKLSSKEIEALGLYLSALPSPISRTTGGSSDTVPSNRRFCAGFVDTSGQVSARRITAHLHRSAIPFEAKGSRFPVRGAMAAVELVTRPGSLASLA